MVLSIVLLSYVCCFIDDLREVAQGLLVLLDDLKVCCVCYVLLCVCLCCVYLIFSVLSNYCCVLYFLNMLLFVV